MFIKEDNLACLPIKEDNLINHQMDPNNIIMVS